MCAPVRNDRRGNVFSFFHSFFSSLNHVGTYYKIYESLRESFYNAKWEFQKCEKHTVFASYGTYPLKGFHILLEAIYLLKTKYPDIKLYAIGENPFSVPFYRLNSYQAHLKRLIKKYKINNHIAYLGFLDEKQMLDNYLRSNVFVSPSSIENSSNSIGEAQLVGVPTVASFVGGNSSFIKHYENGLLYPFDAPYMLAFYIDLLFQNEGLAQELSNCSRLKSQSIFDRDNNFFSMQKLYDVLSNGLINKNDKL